jgi:hypothetical protein
LSLEFQGKVKETIRPVFSAVAIIAVDCRPAYIFLTSFQRLSVIHLTLIRGILCPFPIPVKWVYIS